MSTFINCAIIVCWKSAFVAAYSIPHGMNLQDCRSFHSTGAVITRNSGGYQISYAHNYRVYVPRRRVFPAFAGGPPESQVCSHTDLSKTHTKWIIRGNAKGEHP